MKTMLRKRSLRILRMFERYLWLMLSTGAMLVVIFLSVKFFVINTGEVNGRSMEPTFIDQDTFFINKMVYLFHTPERYDVVQVIDPQEHKLLIKRVIGLPGEIVAVRRGKVFIKKLRDTQEQELWEPYLSSSIYTMVRGQKDAVRVLVGQHQYYILGDNRPQSGDSRNYGPVDRSRILGKVIGRH